MKFYIRTAISLEQYMNTDFNLSDENVQIEIAEYAKDKLIQTLKKKRGWKNKEIWIDDLNWSANEVFFEVMEGLDNYIGSFTCKLNFYDEPSESFDDVEYMIDNAISDFITENIY